MLTFNQSSVRWSLHVHNEPTLPSASIPVASCTRVSLFEHPSFEQVPFWSVIPLRHACGCGVPGCGPHRGSLRPASPFRSQGVHWGWVRDRNACPCNRYQRHVPFCHPRPVHRSVPESSRSSCESQPSDAIWVPAASAGQFSGRSVLSGSTLGSLVWRSRVSPGYEMTGTLPDTSVRDWLYSRCWGCPSRRYGSGPD